jgi:hypothetical protein
MLNRASLEQQAAMWAAAPAMDRINSFLRLPADQQRQVLDRLPANERVSFERFVNERVTDQRVSDQRVSDQRVTDQRVSDQRADQH